jgi:hypothetical protein
MVKDPMTNVPVYKIPNKDLLTLTNISDNVRVIGGDIDAVFVVDLRGLDKVARRRFVKAKRLSDVADEYKRMMAKTTPKTS